MIENLLDEARSKNPDIEWAFARSDDNLEPVFVKNLETVQGDERDVILFSITFGPDQSGYVSMNFGPLNRTGGERRLNVAMTRARSEMVVYSSLKPDQISLSRTQAQAVADLKHFLVYAEQGPISLGSFDSGPVGDFDSPFEVAVARALRDRGWVVHPQIGVSAYRIDLGIVHPDKPGSYMVGIECDGAMYHSSAFARERDKIRQAVLEGLGWTLLRVWSTDWWTYQAGAISKLDDALRKLLAKDKQRDIEEKNKTSAEAEQKDLLVCADIFLQTAVSAELEQKDSDELAYGGSQVLAEQIYIKKSHGETNIQAAQLIRSNLSGGISRADMQTEYRYTLFNDGKYTPSPEAFYSEAYQKRLICMIEHVLEVEGPVHQQVLVRRIARHHGFQRSGGQIQDIVLAITESLSDITCEEVGRFFWKRGSATTELSAARVLDRNDEMRKIEYICKEEILAIARYLHVENSPLGLARGIGISRLSQEAKKRICAVLDCSIDQND